MVMQSPYAPVYPTVFIMDAGAQPVIDVRLGGRMGTHAALDKIETVFKKYNPAQPFAYKFVDEEYAQKFGYMVITLVTVSYQSIKAARTNPVKSIRTE